MNKNNIIGFSLIAVVLIAFSWFNQPSAEQIEAQMKQDSIEHAQQLKAQQAQKLAEQTRKAEAEAAAKGDTTNVFHAALNGENQDIVLKNQKLELTISTKGGMLSKAVIKDFTGHHKNQEGKYDPALDTQDLTLFEGQDQSLNFLLAGKADNIITKEMFFTPSNVTDSTVTMTLPAAGGGSLIIDYKLNEDYLLSMQVRVEGLSGMFAPNYTQMDLEWDGRARQQEKGFTFENRYATLTYKESKGGTDYLSETSAKEDEKIEEQLDWVAFKNQFFSIVLISKDNFAGGSLLTSIPQEKETGYLKNYKAKLKTAFDPTGQKASEFEFYIGPNNYRLLQHIEDKSQFGKDLDLQQLVYLGWPLFRYINRFFTIYVFDWLTSWGLPMGIVLILITLLLKAITYPLVKKSYMSSAKMRVLKPKLDALTKEYDKPEDAMKKQQKMMEMYSRYGVSPLSGCLPMLIQMPIWIAMFNFVPNAIQLRGQSFLWIEDLSTYDPIIEWGSHIWGIGDHLSLTCILFCVANLAYSFMTMRQQRDQMVGQQAEQMKMMQWMMYLMPLMFFFMFNDYSAGLNFYYFISLFFSAAIMWTLRKTTNDAKLLAILEARYQENKNNPKKTSGLAARLEAMQQKADELKKQRENGFKK
ncbi:MAG: membrane protein insertase YidC [Prevotella sp.]|jgi:YidC/Oxa1 family membrane protein insertase|nr:membrane protein insertase YidC [Prevotella sp.]